METGQQLCARLNVFALGGTKERKTVWEDLKSEIRRCVECSSRKEAFFPVPGEGNLFADVMIVGRAPGKTENIEGRPFCGPSGRSLEWFLSLAELTRSDVFITNMCLCYPFKDRPNTSEEIFKCRKYFKRTLAVVNPKIVVVCGSQAVHELTGLKSLLVARGKVWNHSLGFKVICILHPGTVPLSRYAKKNVESLREDAFLLKDTLRKLKEENSG